MFQYQKINIKNVNYRKQNRPRVCLSPTTIKSHKNYFIFKWQDDQTDRHEPHDTRWHKNIFIFLFKIC